MCHEVRRSEPVHSDHDSNALSILQPMSLSWTQCHTEPHEGRSPVPKVKLHELRFRASHCLRRTSSRCSDDEVSSLLELLLAAGATIFYTLVTENGAMQPADALPTHQRCLFTLAFAYASSRITVDRGISHYCLPSWGCKMAFLGKNTGTSTYKALPQTLDEL